jgi:hypothetical protein
MNHSFINRFFKQVISSPFVDKLTSRPQGGVLTRRHSRRAERLPGEAGH